MAIRLDVSQLTEVLRGTPSHHNLMLIGKHGLGKSEILRRFFETERGMKVVAFFLGQMSDPGDLIGLMHKDEASGRSVFLPPYWWPVDGKPVVLFLDELNRARPEILQSIHDLALNKTLAGKRLPEGSIVISAVNEGDEYQLTELDPALVSRFNLYEFAPTAEDWVIWANETGLDPRVINFIQKESHFLDGDATATEDKAALHSGLVKSPDRRAWVRVSEYLRPIDRVTDFHLRVLGGIVGPTAASAFGKSLRQTITVPAHELLLSFEKVREKVERMPLQELIMLNEQVVYWMNSPSCEPKHEKKVRKSLLAYLHLLQARELREAIAHVASILESPKVAKAKSVWAGSMEIVQFLTEYVESIQVH
ncbi:MAG: AAA family ATPase [Deltaproteobacteria bacterium]|nr:AAA family ATPase [Deltaproteobacteria bacterium]